MLDRQIRHQRRAACAALFLTICAGLGPGGCRSATDPTSKPLKASSLADAAVPTSASATPSASSATPAATAATLPTLWPLYEGACGRASTHAVGNLAVHVFSHGIWAFDTPAPRQIYRDDAADTRPSNTTSGIASFGKAGGADEAHMWVERYYPARGDGAYGGLLFAATGWKPANVVSNRGNDYDLSTYLPQPDGSLWAFGAEIVFDGPYDQRFFAWSSSGVLLRPNLPGRDMAGAKRLESGELVAPGKTAAKLPLLRRWSPTKPLNDLPIPGVAALKDDDWPLSAVGTARALVTMPKPNLAFYIYENEAIVASPLNGRLAGTTSWLLTQRDELFVTKADGTILYETHGSVSEERAPEAGTLAPERSAPWLIADSGALYTRFEGKWVKVPMPLGPWSAAGRPAAKVESVSMVGGETFVSTVRTDLGFGRTKAGSVRTVYGSRQRASTLRCGAPFALDHVDALPPAATATCTSRLVVIGRDTAASLPKTYPKIGAVLKGDPALGDTLAFVSFGLDKTPVLAIAAPTAEVASALVSKLARVTPHAPEVVCGAVVERRRLSFDVKTGAFAAP